MKEDKLKYLVHKYYRGETSLEEELELREALAQDASGEWENEKTLFSMFAEAANERAPQIEIDFDAPSAPAEKPSSRLAREIRLSWPAAIAAAVSLLIGLGAGFFLGSGNNSAEMTALKNDIREIKELTILNKLKDDSPSERILAAYQVQEFDQADDETIVALVNVLNMDDNVNVRIAAADALFKFGGKDIVRKAFIQALSREEDPNLQIRLINMLVMLNETRAIPKLQEMMNSDDQMQIVRQTAANGIGQLL